MQQRPLTLTVLAAAAGVEGLAFLAAAVGIAVTALRNGLTGPEEVSNAQGFILELVIFTVFGLGLLLCARGWWRAQRWARSIHVLGQLLILVVSVASLGAIEPTQQVLAWVATVIAGGTLVLALTPAVTRSIVQPD